MSGDVSVTYFLPERVDDSLSYQRYYLLGLADRSRLDITPETLSSRVIRDIGRKVELLPRRPFRPRRALEATPSSDDSTAHTGCYVANFDSREVRFAVDARDSHPIYDNDILDWCDVYFKANKWDHLSYESKVLPIVNGNGLMTKKRLRRLARLRGREKDVDVAFIANVWGGRDHNIRLFEEVAKLGGRTDVLAIFPSGYDQEETDAMMARLRSRGVQVSTQPIALEELWDRLARAKVVFMRAGKHMCISWRMIDLLCMGACIALDSAPVPRWPEPLISGVNFVDCGIERPLDTSEAESAEYERVVPTLEEILADRQRMEAIQRENASYFDAHASPARVGEYVLSTLRELTHSRGAG